MKVCFRQILAITLALFINIAAKADGPGITGGANARAIEFVRLAWHIYHWIKTGDGLVHLQSQNQMIKVSPDSYYELIELLQDSLQNPNLKAMIRFPDGADRSECRTPLTDRDGIAKDAIYNQQTQVICVDQQDWDLYEEAGALPKLYSLVAAETFSLLRLNAYRVEIAMVVADHFHDIRDLGMPDTELNRIGKLFRGCQNVQLYAGSMLEFLQSTIPDEWPFDPVECLSQLYYLSSSSHAISPTQEELIKKLIVQVGVIGSAKASAILYQFEVIAEHPHSWARPYLQEVIMALGGIKSIESEYLLQDILMKSHLPLEVRMAAAESLGSKRSINSVRSLQSTMLYDLGNEDPRVWLASVKTSNNNERPDFIFYPQFLDQRLFLALNNSLSSVRCAAARALGRIGTGAALQALNSSIDLTHPNMRKVFPVNFRQEGDTHYLFDIRTNYNSYRELDAIIGVYFAPLMPEFVYCVAKALLQNQQSPLGVVKETVKSWKLHFDLRGLGDLFDTFQEMRLPRDIRREWKQFAEEMLNSDVVQWDDLAQPESTYEASFSPVYQVSSFNQFVRSKAEELKGLLQNLVIKIEQSSLANSRRPLHQP